MESVSGSAGESRWKEEAAAGKRLQGFLNEEKKLRVHLEEECTTLQAKLAEEKVKLERYKELLKLAQTDTTTEKANSKETTLPAPQMPCAPQIPCS